jgi:glycosyltransferase involved in cell wall biosynthesis
MYDIAIVTGDWRAGYGHGTLVRNLIPHVLKLVNGMKLKIKVYKIRPFEIKLGHIKIGWYLTFWPIRFLTHPNARIVHALDSSVATLNTNVVTLHDMGHIVFPDVHLKTEADRIEWSYRKKALLRAKKILSVSEFTKQECVRHLGINGNKIEVCVQGIDRAFAPTSEKSEFYKDGRLNIVTAGQNERKKNFPVLIEALGVLKEKGYDINFVRFGPSNWPEETRKMQETARRYGITLVEPGVVGVDVLRRAYSSFDVFVWPSIYEGMGYPPLEALACGAKVVALDLPFNREFMGDVAVYVKNEPGAIAEGILEALKMEIGDKGIKQAKKYTWERCASQHLKIYLDLLQAWF